jgi:hypothetical protein
MPVEIEVNALTEYVHQNPSFLRGYQASQANVAVVEKIRQALPEAKLVVVAEYWCGDSRRLVPLMARIGDLLPGWEFEAHPWDRSGRVKDLNIRAIPTFIVFRGEHEIGRIVEYPRTGSLEDDLLLIAGQR